MNYQDNYYERKIKWLKYLRFTEQLKGALQVGSYSRKWMMGLYGDKKWGYGGRKIGISDWGPDRVTTANTPLCRVGDVKMELWMGWALSKLKGV